MCSCSRAKFSPLCFFEGFEEVSYDGVVAVHLNGHLHLTEEFEAKFPTGIFSIFYPPCFDPKVFEQVLEGREEVALGVVAAVYSLGHEEEHFSWSWRNGEPSVGFDVEAQAMAGQEVYLHPPDGSLKDEVPLGSLAVDEGSMPPPAVPLAVEEPEESAEDLEEASLPFVD